MLRWAGGDLATAADAEIRLRTEVNRPGNFLHPASPRSATSLRALVTMPPQRARTVIGSVVRELDERQAPTVSRAYGFRILAAEADRRAGDLGSALRNLGGGLAAGRVTSDFTQSVPGGAHRRTARRRSR